MEKIVINEKITNITKYFIVALPENLEDLILVSSLCFTVINGMLYYSDNTIELLDETEQIEKYMSPEYAQKYIPGYKKGMKITLVEAFCNFDITYIVSDTDINKANKKLHDKLYKMTLKQFYGKW